MSWTRALYTGLAVVTSLLLVGALLGAYAGDLLAAAIAEAGL